MNTTTGSNTVWHPVTNTTRASKHGTFILCTCGNVERVYHFAWSAIFCPPCGRMMEKNQWQVPAHNRKAN
jgi:ribosomal protein S27E